MRSIQAPIPDPTTAPFWDACREGRLMVGLCRDTGRHFFPPRGVSPFTLSPHVGLVPASGQGVLYSYTVMRTKEPYIPAMVALAEGPRIFTNLVEVAPDYEFDEAGHFDRADHPRLAFVEREWAHDWTNWWVPNRAGVEAMLRASGFAIAAVHVGHQARVGPFEIEAFGRIDNLFDRRYAGSVIVGEGNGRFFEPAPGRTWTAGLSGRVRF